MNFLGATNTRLTVGALLLGACAGLFISNRLTRCAHMAYGNPQRLYVIELASGVIKAGITSLAGNKRLDQHAAREVVARQFITAKYITGIEAERALLARLAEVGVVSRGREWFTGVKFEHAVGVAEDVAREFENAAPVFHNDKLRTGRGNLSFNDRELAVLDAYCALKGQERSVACRELVLGGVVEMLS
jgi:hypothetical protein